MTKAELDAYYKKRFGMDEHDEEVHRKAVANTRPSNEEIDALRSSVHDSEKSISERLNKDWLDRSERVQLTKDIYDYQNTLARLQANGQNVGNRLKRSDTLLAGAGRISQTFSPYASRDEYLKAYNKKLREEQEEQERKELFSVDLDAQKKAANEKREAATKAKADAWSERLRTWLQSMSAGQGALNPYGSRTNAAYDLQEKHNRAKQTSDAASKAETLYTRATWAQDADKLESDAVTAPDFSAYAEKGAETSPVNAAQNYYKQYGTFASTNFLPDFGEKLGKSRYDYMNEQETAVYNYYYQKEQEGAVPAGTAQRYYDSIAQKLESRVAEDVYEDVEGKRALEMVFGVGAGIDQFTTGAIGAVDMVSGNQTSRPVGATQIASSYVREDLGDAGFKIGDVSFGQALYDTITTTANMLPSIGLSAAANLVVPGAGAAVGAASIGASAAGNAYQEMIRAGYDTDSARTYAVLTGASEAGLEYVLGGISALGGKLAGKITGKTLESVTKNIGNALAKFSVQNGGKFLGEMASEGLEEFMQDILDPFFKAFATGEIPDDIDLGQAIYSGVLGALSAGLMNVAGGVATQAQNMATVRQLAKNGDVQTLINLGKSFDQGSVANMLATEAEANNGQIGTARGAMLLHDAQTNLSSQTRTDYENALTAAGIDPARAAALAEDAAKASETGKISRQLRETMDSDAAVGETVGEMLVNRESSVNRRYNALSAVRGGEAVAGTDLTQTRRERTDAKTTANRLEHAFRTGQTLQNTSRENLIRTAYKQYAENENPASAVNLGRAQAAALAEPAADATYKAFAKRNFGVDLDAVARKVDANTGVDPSRVERIENGKATFGYGKNKTAPQSAARYASNEAAVLFETAPKMGFDAQTTNNIIRMVDKDSSTPILAQLLQIQDAVERGRMNVPIDMNAPSMALPRNVRDFAYRLGRDSVRAENAEKQVKIAEKTQAEKQQAQTEAKTETIRDGGRTAKIKTVGVDTAKLSSRQRRSVMALQTITSRITNNDIVFYESELRDGKRILAADVAGYRAGTKAPNGFYDPKTGTVYLDINAGQQGEGTVMWTAAHEFTHFMRQWSPEKFQKLADFLMEQYGERGIDADALIREQQQKAARSGRTLSRDEAYEEVVADSMQTMFTDTDAWEKMESLKNADRSIWEQLKNFIRRITQSLRSAYEGLEPYSQEARLVRGMTADAIDTLSSLLAEGLTEAGESFAAAGVSEETAEPVQFDDRDGHFTDLATGEDVKFSIREEDPPKKTLKGYKVFFVKDGKLYPPMVANPNGADTPVGVWLNADVGVQAPDSKTGRKQVKAGGKGTQGGSGSLAFRPGWHLGEIPLATQFDRLNPETGVKELFPENFVWAECEIAADVDYQDEAMSYGYTKNGKFQHSLAGLPRLPVDGYYKYRTNPNPETVPWLITGAMKVTRLLSDADVNEILAEHGIAPKQRVGGEKTLEDLGLFNSAFPNRKFTYDELISKDPIKVVDVSSANATSNKDVISSARSNAASVAKVRNDGSIFVHIKDTDSDVIIGRRGLLHSLGRRFGINSKYSEFAAEILHNSVLINEAKPELVNADISLIYVGVVKKDNNTFDVVESVVNRFSGEVESMDVLYSINGNNKKGTGAQNTPQAFNPVPRTSFTIAELLDSVKDKYPEILPAHVLNHFGFSSRPKSDSKLEESVYHSDREENVPDARTLLSTALLDTAQNDAERARLAEYQAKIGEMNAQQEKLDALNAQIKELSVANGKRDTAKLKALREEAVKTRNRINIYDKQLLRLEASKPLERVVQTETDKAIRREREKGRAKLTEAQRQAAERLDEAVREARQTVRERERAKANERVENAVRKQKEHHRAVMQNAKERRDSTNVRNKIRRLRADWQNMLLKGNENTHIPAPLVQGMIDVCDMIDPTGRDPDTKAAEKIRTGREALQALRTQYDRLNTAKDMDVELKEEYRQELSDRMLELADAVGDTPVRDMDLNQLEDVYNIMAEIKHTLQNAKKQIGTDRAITNYETGQNIINLMETVRKRELNDGKRLGKLRGILRNWMTNPLRAVQEMSGYDPDSELTRLIYDIRDGLIKGDRFRMEATKVVDALRESKEDRQAFNDATEKAFDFGLTDVNGKPLKISKMQAMQILMTWQREQDNDNRAHLEREIIIPDVDLLRKGKTQAAFDNAQVMPVLTLEDTEKILSNLSDWDKRFMEAAKKVFYEMSSDAVNETSMLLIGRPIATEKSYIPYEIDKDFLARDSENVKFDASVGGMGMTKSMTPNAKQPLVMRGLNAVLENHINDVAKYSGLAVPVRNWNKAFNVQERMVEGGRSVKKAIRNTWGEAGLALLDQAVADVQGPRRTERSKLFDSVKSGFVVSTLASNISVAIKQAASYPTAGVYLSVPALKKGVNGWIGLGRKGRRALLDEIDAHTPMSWTRRQGLSTQELGDINQSKGWANQINRRLGKASPMNWIQTIDVNTTAALWVACKAEAERQGAETGTDEYWARVTELYNKVIEDTQPMYDPLHRAEITKNARYKFVMFQTQPIQNSGILRDATYRFKDAKKTYGKDSAEAKAAGKQFKAAVASQLSSHFVFTAMTLLANMLLHRMNNYRDDEDKKVTFESVGEEFMKEWAQNVFSAIFPVIGNYAWDLAEKVTGGNRYDILSDPTLDKVNGTIEAFQNIKQPNFKTVSTLAYDIAGYFGIPAGNAGKIIEGVVRHTIDAINGEFGTFESGVERTKTQMGRVLYEAYESGKQDDIDRAKAAFGDESEADKWLTAAVKENFTTGDIDDDEALRWLIDVVGKEAEKAYYDYVEKWAAEKEGNADYNKYADFVEAVQTGKDLASVIRSYTDHGVTKKTLASNITKHFKPLYQGMTNTERAALKGYLLNAYEKLGYDRAQKSKDIDAWLK